MARSTQAQALGGRMASASAVTRGTSGHRVTRPPGPPARAGGFLQFPSRSWRVLMLRVKDALTETGHDNIR